MLIDANIWVIFFYSTKKRKKKVKKVKKKGFTTNLLPIHGKKAVILHALIN